MKWKATHLLGGVVVLNVPANMASRECGLAFWRNLPKDIHHDVKNFKNVNRKVVKGYTGALPSFATGCVVSCYGKATKLIPHLNTDTMKYSGLIKLGVQTDNGGFDGRVVDTKAVPEITQDELNEVAQAMAGKIKTKTPFSANVKLGDKKLPEILTELSDSTFDPETYATHFQKIAADIPRSNADILSINLKLLNKDTIDVKLSMKKDSYIASIGEYIGEELGTVSYFAELSRDSVGMFSINQHEEHRYYSLLEILERLSNCITASGEIKTLSEAILHGKDILPSLPPDLKQGMHTIMVDHPKHGRLPLLTFKKNRTGPVKFIMPWIQRPKVLKTEVKKLEEFKNNKITPLDL